MPTRRPVAGQVGVTFVPVRTPTLPPATHTNTWVLGQTDVVIVDPASPWPDQQQVLSEALVDVSVRAILLTHHHADHVGGVEALRRTTGAPVLAHRLTADRVPFPVDGILTDGDRVQTDLSDWRVLHTPGHAVGHLCLFDPRGGAMIAGDMVASVGTIVLDPPDGQLGHYLESLERMRALDSAVLLPAHGTPIAESGKHLDEYIRHRGMRTDQYRSVLAARGPCTPLEVVPRVYSDLSERYFPVAARQVLCHLQWLAERGAVHSLDDGRWALSEDA